MREVEDHLRQRVEELQAAGWEPREAKREAIARFGTPLKVVDQFRQPPLPCEEEIMFRRSMTMLAALTSVYAALHVVFSLLNEPTAIFTYVKIVYAVIIVGYGMLIFHWQWVSRGIGEIERCAIFIGGMGLIEIGTANIVWTAHLGLVSGDWEFYGFLGGALISLLGAIAATWLAFPNFPITKHDPQPIA
ncbi:MAG: hypothetical protein IH831_00985 [Planctomycetes bacterium]|nr:hypothetical protein [Planctomycetota bacterium]